MEEIILDTTITYREYCLIPNDGRRHEILEGYHYMTPAPRPKHQDTSKGFFSFLFAYFEVGRGWKVYYAPIDVILTERDVVQPDLVVVINLSQISNRGIEGPPFLIVEILSPSDPDYDRRIKAQRYAALGVPHYWIADPEAKILECYRNEGGRYVMCVSGRAPDSLTHPDFPDLTIPLASIWPA